MIVALLTLLIGLLVGLYWGERARRLDLLHRTQYAEERPATPHFGPGLMLTHAVQHPDADRDISKESIELTARYLRQEAAALGRPLTPDEAARQAQLMLAGQDV